MVFHNLIKVLVMSPTHFYIIQSTIFFVYAKLGTKCFVCIVRVVFEELRIYYFIRISTTHRKCISYYCPLRLSKKTQHLTHIMNKTGKNKPIWMAVGSYSL